MTVGIIPARGGSKGLPRKNIRRIGGFPLVYWSIEAARKSSLLKEFYVSTEDEEIAATAIKYGAPVLWRPLELASDTSTTIEVLRHHLREIHAETIVVLQPTSPLRDDESIDDAIREYQQGGYDTLATGYYTKIIEYGTHQNLRRQDIKGFFYDDGNLYILDRQIVEKGRWFGDKICRRVNPRELSFEIDDPLDYDIVEMLLIKRLQSGVQPSDFNERLAQIKLLALDVDGVLTDAGMYYAENGDELKKFNTRDGLGLRLLREAGLKTAVLTSEKTELVRRRVEKLKIDHLIQGCENKAEALENILHQENIRPEEVAYIGDDLNDLSVLQLVGLPMTVSNAVPEVKQIARYITPQKGGNGAVRHVCDLLLRSRQ